MTEKKYDWDVKNQIKTTKKSADDNKSIKNYSACKKLNVPVAVDLKTKQHVNH